MSEVQAVAVIPFRAEDADAMREPLSELVKATRVESGCLAYDLFESGSTPGTFVTVERWQSQDDLDAHLQTPHVAAAMSTAAEHLAGAIGIHPLKPVDV